MYHKTCNIEYDNELNNRLNTRYFPSVSLKPNFNPVPVSTKYTLFPVIDKNKFSNMSLDHYKEYNTKTVFYPGNTKPPVKFALDNVDVESRLRNQYFALQKNDRAFYIPPINSNMYMHNSHLADKPNKEENQETNIIFNPDKCNLAPKKFNNSTRYNLKNL